MWGEGVLIGKLFDLGFFFYLGCLKVAETLWGDRWVVLNLI
jgi:hypothetical protein